MAGTEIPMVKSALPDQPKGWAPFALGFRPFFLLAGWFGLLFMVTSLGGFLTGIWHYNYFDLSLWHAHEMLFGFVVAVVAGFLLTAVRNWTGIATPTGWPLALLVLLWLLPRLLSALPVTRELFALLDMLFLPVLAVVLFLNLRRAEQSRNYSVPVLLMLLAITNGAIHLEQLAYLEGYTEPMLHLAIVTVLAVIVLIGGRVMPFFIGSATGEKRGSIAWVESMALPSVLMFAVINLLLPQAGLVALVALMVAIIHAIRLASWYVNAIWRQPMLWILWLAYLWLVAGFLLYAASLLFGWPLTEALHAWSIGAVSMFILGMMARVSLGHTGRPVQPLSWMPVAFLLLIIACFARVLMPILNPAWLQYAVVISALCWSLAFLVFAFRYSALLLRPRVDGKEG